MRVVETLIEWFATLPDRGAVDDCLVYGSVIYDGGKEFRQNSDVDLVFRLNSALNIGAHKRVACVSKLRGDVARLENRIRSQLSRQEDVRAIISPQCYSELELRCAIQHGDPRFLTTPQFYSLTTQEYVRLSDEDPGFAKLNGAILAPIHFVQALRHEFLQWPYKESAGGNEHFVKAIYRNAAIIAYHQQERLCKADLVAKTQTMRTNRAAGRDWFIENFGQCAELANCGDYFSEAITNLTSSDPYANPCSPRARLLAAEFLCDAAYSLYIPTPRNQFSVTLPKKFRIQTVGTVAGGG